MMLTWQEPFRSYTNKQLLPNEVFIVETPTQKTDADGHKKRKLLSFVNSEEASTVSVNITMST